MTRSQNRISFRQGGSGLG